MTEKDQAPARILEANRAQMRFVPMDLEGMLAGDHQARAVWAFVECLDLSGFHARIQSRDGSAGRPATDPQIPLGLSLLATRDGAGAARGIARGRTRRSASPGMCGAMN